MIQEEQLLFYVVTDSVYQFYFQKRFPADEVEHHGILREQSPVPENIVDGLCSYLERHPFLGVLAYEIAVLAGKLAVLGDDESDVLGHSILPRTTRNRIGNTVSHCI